MCVCPPPHPGIPLTIEEGTSVRGDGGGWLAGDIARVPVIAQAELEAQELGAGWHHGGRIKDPAQPKTVAGQVALGQKERKKKAKIPPK